MTVLQKIQRDIADFRKSIEAKVNDVAETVFMHGKKLDKIEQLMTYHLGITSQHTHAIKTVETSFEYMQPRLANFDWPS